MTARRTPTVAALRSAVHALNGYVLSSDISSAERKQLTSVLAWLEHLTRERRRKPRMVNEPMTAFEHEWLASAYGHRDGFNSGPTIALRRLRERGYLESDPSTFGSHTHWRITEAGQAAHEQRATSSRHDSSTE